MTKKNKDEVIFITEHEKHIMKVIIGILIITSIAGASGYGIYYGCIQTPYKYTVVAKYVGIGGNDYLLLNNTIIYQVYSGDYSNIAINDTVYVTRAGSIVLNPVGY